MMKGAYRVWAIRTIITVAAVLLVWGSFVIGIEFGKVADDTKPAPTPTITPIERVWGGVAGKHAGPNGETILTVEVGEAKEIYEITCLPTQKACQAAPLGSGVVYDKDANGNREARFVAEGPPTQ